MLDALAEAITELPLELLFVAHTLIGIVAARIATQKGRNWRLWVPLGLICGTPALIVAVLMKPIPPHIP